METKKSTIERILDNGWDINTLTTHKVNQEAENPQILQMKQEMAKLSAKMTEREQRLERKERLSGIKQFLSQNPDEFEFTLLHNYEEKVLQLQDHFFENEKKILSDREAAKAIEDELYKYESDKAGRLANSKKGKEVYKILNGKATGLSSSEKGREQQKPSPLKPEAEQTEAHQTTSSETSKPKSIFPPVAKKPVVKYQVANPLTKEVDGSFKHPNRAKSKAEVMQRIVAAFGQNS